MTKLIMGDCLRVMRDIPDGAVDMILTDMPYGTTMNDWDTVPDLEAVFSQYRRVIKENGAMVLFPQMPFCVDLINANRRQFRYEWIWRKDCGTGFLNSKKMPLKVHENILVFYKRLPVYNPQFAPGKPYVIEQKSNSINYGGQGVGYKTVNCDGKRYPVDVIAVPKPKPVFGKGEKHHPTEKPVELCEYLIKTYTNEGDVVLDSFMGSGSTGVACVNTGRRFIGIELLGRYVETAAARIDAARRKKYGGEGVKESGKRETAEGNRPAHV